MTTTSGHETGLISPTGVNVGESAEAHQKLAEANTATLENLIEDAVLQMKQGGTLNTSFYDAEDLGRIVDAAVSLRLRKLEAIPHVDFNEDPKLFSALAASSFTTYGRATEEEAADIVAAYERSKQPPEPVEEVDEVAVAEETAPQPPEMSATEKMAHLGSTVLAAEDVSLKPSRQEPTIGGEGGAPLKSLPSMSELMGAAWRLLPKNTGMLPTMIEMPGLDSAARSFAADEVEWERAAEMLEGNAKAES